MPTPLLFLLCSLTYSIVALDISVIDHGAIGDGTTYDTNPIQSAIDACHHRGGGHVIFPPNHSYLTATIFLKSNVILVIEKGAKILAGTKESDYPKEFDRWYLVLAEQVSGVGVTGGGEINGQGWEFIDRESEVKNVMVSWNSSGSCFGDECRPRLIGFIDSTDVRVWNVTLNQPAYWCFHVVRCNNTLIQDVWIYGDFNSPNNDGIDIEGSNNTIIRRCHIDTGDDAICPKTSTGPLYNLTVTDCWIRTKSSAVKLGSGSYFGFDTLLFDNITIVDSHRGLAMQIRDGGNVSNVVFSNIKMSTRYYDPLWWGRAEPIYVTTCPRDSSSKTGTISNVMFVNISATSENGVFLSGSERGILSNVKFRNVNLTYKRWTRYSGGLYDYRPGCQGLVKHGLGGIMMEHISGIDVNNLKMRWSKSNGLKGWDNPLQFRPSTVNKISFHDLQSQVY